MLRDYPAVQEWLAEEGARGRLEGEIQGRIGEARRMLELAASPRLGVPGEAVSRRFDEITELDVLEQMVQRIHSVESWEELLQQAGRSACEPGGHRGQASSEP